ncbi:MAG: TrpR YerC/YecD [Epulopiscium sp.]|nr:TrpR YerC/YecD [Candidatus Epulonipiscium sp.]
MASKIKSPLMDDLFEAILCLETLDECYAFFEDIWTIQEAQSMAQRLAVAKMLQDKQKYLDISEKTGASTATISRVNKALNYGADGYKMILARIKKGNTQGE